MNALRLAAGTAALVLGAALPARAQAVVVIPDATTAQCADGTWSKAASQKGACSAHGGVKLWIGRKPRGASARCTDGTYWTNAALQGACSSHGGVYKSYKKAKKAAKHAEKKAVKS